MMVFQKGNISWNKGKHCSEETKEKLRVKAKIRCSMGITLPPSHKGEKFSEEHKKKISIANTGIKKSESFKKSRQGINNPNYTTGISSSKRIILEIKKMCEICGSNRYLEVHHKDGDRTNNILSNLILLCKSCHTREHKKKEWNDKIIIYKKDDLIKTQGEKLKNGIYC